MISVNRFTPRLLALIFIWVPMGLTSFYLAFIAAPRYVTQSVITVRGATVSATPLTNVIATGSPTPLSYQDSLFLYNFIQSADILETLEKRLQLRKHFESPKLDIIFRLWKNTSKEWFLFYYQQVVSLTFDDASGLLTITTQGFDANTSQKLNQAILDASEVFVNEYSNRVAREQMEFAEQESLRSAQKLQEANAKLVNFQSENKLLDPVAQSAANTTLFSTLQASLATQESQLKLLLAYLQEDSYQVKALRDQINATRAQLDAERVRTTSTASNERINNLMAQFTTLQMEAGFAATNYGSAVAALQAARIDAARKLWSLVVVEKPIVPESAQYPRWLFDLVTLFVVCVISYTVARLTVLTIREHQD